MLHTVILFELADLICDRLWSTNLEFIPRDGFRAPVAPVGATAAGDHVGRESAVSRNPCLPVGLKVNQLACRLWQVLPVRIARRLRRALNNLARRVKPHDTRNLG